MSDIKDREANNFHYEEIINGSETRILTLRDLTPSTIKRIAAVSLEGPDENTDVGHAFARRYGTREFLTYLATMPLNTPIKFTESTVGLHFPKPKEDPFSAKATTINTFNSKQEFLRGHANDMAFLTNRLLGRVPIENLRVFLPSWIIGVNQITSASPADRNKEIDTMIGEQGWIVGFLGMAASGMEEKEILKYFEIFERDYGVKTLKKGWLTDSKGINQLPNIIKSTPKFQGVRLDFDTLNEIERNIDFLYKILPEKNLPPLDPREIRERAPIIIKIGSIIFVLPSEQEYNIREAVQAGRNKADIHRTPKISEPSGKIYIDRFITVYPDIEEVEFYPFVPFKVYDKEAGH
ncbi:hypothetical protein A2865_02940 [Candidatus Woesebacteria bacterium RIFCSPHIGHO2_01_FULL_39_17]|uniref:Uncharacterized protein n=3 Tax=Candidatus Woeseibacteriota TaxID=1752722 RepID=A0A0G0RI86_9BACT|nr:MAG: hypothetical protein UT19_C0001G0073 [Candidatus Woesebacteria bacterium GW2011_GWB1_39_10b]KKR13377.1 MAG: hypothetical protein UT40_C0018G0022 [Candidatus Woesebacteria bacterium GW2011_GWA1_39_21b]KKS89707.1 MAG: hypothetical protein UV64_C0002G0041 [Parcubacteria group bacterium GW2011_GWC1_43_11b]OGM23695.1 MAG: hypothetical protein A2865_02940 [Candidatus Woesebacteria bacterium RIFCSPHIGHO2_01_FULL_39_17]OGM63876.1 MAG: hypothetical protein A3A52_03905 [Candidatus Woesebacteria b